jgi:hypothetical protein
MAKCKMLQIVHKDIKQTQLKKRFTVFQKGMYRTYGLYLSSKKDGNDGYICMLSGCVPNESVRILFPDAEKIVIHSTNALLKYILHGIFIQLIQYRKVPFGLLYYRLQRTSPHAVYWDKSFKIVAKQIYSGFDENGYRHDVRLGPVQGFGCFLRC